jgi:hypothetical protein
LQHRSSSSYQIHSDSRCLFFPEAALRPDTRCSCPRRAVVARSSRASTSAGARCRSAAGGEIDSPQAGPPH